MLRVLVFLSYNTKCHWNEEQDLKDPFLFYYC